MALRVAATAPGAFAGVAVHSGAPATAVASAGDGASDAAADPGAAPGEGAGLLRERMGSGARALPLFALHGTADPEIEAGLGRRLVAEWRALQEELGAAPARTETSLGRAPRGGLRYRRTIWWDAGGGPLGEAWIVEDLGHAWSGGRPGPSWSAPRGPDATREMIRFFARARAP